MLLILVPMLMVLLVFVMPIVSVLLVLVIPIVLGQRGRDRHGGNEECSSEQCYHQFGRPNAFYVAAIGLHDVLLLRQLRGGQIQRDQLLLACWGRFSCSANTASAVFF